MGIENMSSGNTPESLSREGVVSKLRENPNDKLPLADYIERRRNESSSSESAFIVAVERAEILEEAELMVDAFVAYYEAYQVHSVDKRWNLGERAARLEEKYNEISERIIAEIAYLRSFGKNDEAEVLKNKLNEAYDYCEGLDK